MTQARFNQSAVSLNDTDFCREADILQRMTTGGPGCAIVPGQIDNIGPGFGDPNRDDPDSRHDRYFDRHFGFGIDGLEFFNQLGKVFNRI